MKKINIILYVLVFFSFDSLSQTITISGIVKDSTSHEALEQTQVFFSNKNQYLNTNSKGAFFFQTNSETKNAISFNLFSYDQLNIIFSCTKDTFIVVYLKKSEYQLEEVVINGNSDLKRSQNRIVGLTSIPIERLVKIPILFGEADLLKALSMTPGVSNGNEGTSGLFVRGGSPDQNLILLDDAPVYNTAHLFGLISIFNTDAIKSADLYKGYFPSQYGGRLSSVLDVKMKEGNALKKNKELTVGLISSKFFMEGPLKVNNIKTSYMVSFRTSYLTPILLPQMIKFFVSKKGLAKNYWMSDLNLKLSHNISKKAKINFGLYTGSDFFRTYEGLSGGRSTFKLDWGNLLGSVRYSRFIGSKLFFSSVAYYSNYNYKLGSKGFVKNNDRWAVDSKVLNVSRIRDLGAKSDIEWYANKYQNIRFGIETVNHKYRPNKLSIYEGETQIDASSIDQIYQAFEYDFFTDHVLKLNNFWELSTGVRMANFQINNKRYSYWEPRISNNFLLPGGFSFKAAYTQMNQPLHLLNAYGSGLPNDIWVPATNKISPANSKQISLGLSKFIKPLSIDISIEVYKKEIENTIDYKDGESFFSGFDKNWETLVETGGKGESQGLEVFVNKTKGKTNGWISYTKAKSIRKYKVINNGEWFNSNFDKPHNFTFFINHTFNKNYSFSLNWTYQTGNPTTLPIASYLPVSENVNTFLPRSPLLIFGGRNNARLPDYHRLDLSFTKKYINFKGRDAAISFGVYNAYNRVNPYYIEVGQKSIYNSSPNYILNSPEIIVTAVGVLPIVPFISYHVIY
jgi:TonB-dependent Receptor Plug Domain/CarboxypepD_reg-like domain